MKTHLIGGLLLLGSALAANDATADSGLYAGASIGRSTIQASDNVDIFGSARKFKLNGDDTGFKLFGGYMFLPVLGIEVGYVDFGQPDDNTGFSVPTTPQLDVNGDLKVDANGYTASLLGKLPIGPVNVFAKAGILSWKAHAKVNVTATDGTTTASNSFSDNADGNDFTYGVGAGVSFGSLEVRAEYEKYDIGDVDDLYMLSLGLVWNLPI